MRFRQLLVLFTVTLTFSNSSVFSQINTSHFANVYSQDSLQGFDANQANQIALSEGLFGQDYTAAIKLYKRQFVNAKYNLDAIQAQTTATASQSNWFGNSNSSKYSSNTTAVAPCSNEGFENGNLTSWSASVGTNGNSQNYPTTATSITA